MKQQPMRIFLRSWRTIVLRIEKTGDNPLDSFQVRQATVEKSPGKNGYKFAFRAPPLPPWMKSYMAPKVWKCLDNWHKKINKVTISPEDEKLKEKLLNEPHKWKVTGDLSKKDQYKYWSKHNNFNPNKGEEEPDSHSSDRGRYDRKGSRDGRQRHHRDSGHKPYGSHRSSRSASRGGSYDSPSCSRSPPRDRSCSCDCYDRSYSCDPYDRSNTPSVTSRRSVRDDRDHDVCFDDRRLDPRGRGRGCRC